jgi:hypothetical protein
MTIQDEAKVREIAKKLIDQELKKQKEEFEKQILKTIKESEKSQKDDFLASLKKEIDALDKKTMTKEKVKELMIKAFVRQNRFMWEKSKFITSYFNEL